ncbi:hypothetical protein HY229_06970 [Candidatus Acetothermia bacterium]|nr:hypothetical protein [Candidatus Acetothermia bacterium]MBI3643826.1 hypothetical protein [Candidatus Acetothermia bacterium]
MNEELQVLQPMSLGDIIDEALSLYRKNFIVFFGIAIIPGLISAILMLLFVPEVSTPDSDFRSLTDQFTTTDAFNMIGRASGVILISLLGALFANVALVRAVSDRYLGREASIASAYGFVLPRFLPYLGTIFVLCLLFFVATLPAIIPILGLVATLVLYILLGFMSVFVNEVFVIEDNRYFKAFQRSRELARENWGRIFLLCLLWFAISLVMSLAAGLLVRSLFNEQEVLSTFTSEILKAILLPIFFTSLVLLYFDIRVRKEGFDLQLLADELAARSAPSMRFPSNPTNPNGPTTGTGS